MILPILEVRAPFLGGRPAPDRMASTVQSGRGVRERGQREGSGRGVRERREVSFIEVSMSGIVYIHVKLKIETGLYVLTHLDAGQ